jgi:CrcB protein
MDETQLGLVALVAVGGALGSVTRYLISGALTRGDFPWGTFAVNFTGTFLLVLVFFASQQGVLIGAPERTFLFVGIFGGYTTFSTFGLETISLFSEGRVAWAVENIMLNSGLCLVGAWVGMILGLLLTRV